MKLILMIILLSLSNSGFAQEPTEVINGVLFPLPGLIETADSGLFVDVLKEVEACLPPNVKMVRQLYPLNRARLAITGNPAQADFVFPAINFNSAVDEKTLHTKPYGKVSFVIYSNKKMPLTHEMLLAVKDKKPYPYLVESFRAGTDFDFPAKAFACLTCSLKKVNAGRADALVAGMDEMDAEIIKNKMTNIHRELFGNYDSNIQVVKSERGEHVLKILNKAVDCALNKGVIQKKALKVHRPYSNSTLSVEPATP
ncbi:MAG: hypothetical protein ACXWQQ_12725 [Pseudobdellovibrio sp.]